MGNCADLKSCVWLFYKKTFDFFISPLTASFLKLQIDSFLFLWETGNQRKRIRITDKLPVQLMFFRGLERGCSLLALGTHYKKVVKWRTPLTLACRLWFLPEDPGLVSITHIRWFTAACNSGLRDRSPSSVLCGHCIYIVRKKLMQALSHT